MDHWEKKAKFLVTDNPSDSKNGMLTIFTDQPIKLPAYEKCLWPYFFTSPARWLLTGYVKTKKKGYQFFNIPGPKINTFFFDGLGLSCRKVKEYATTWRAMEIIYHHPFPKRFTPRGLVDEYYWYGLNCQALRNRFKLAKHELRKAILEFTDKEEIKLMSLACGSAQTAIESIAEFKANNVIIKAFLVDIDQDALDRARDLAELHGVSSQIQFHQANISEEADIFKNFQPHIVEMLGFLDYVEKEKAVHFIKKIHAGLADDGILITCNIAPNPEQHFLTWVIDWPMVYREASDLAEIAEESGFNDYQIIYEPVNIHGLLVANKT